MKQLSQIFQALLGMAALICTSLIAVGRLAWRIVCNWWKKSSKWFRLAIASSLVLFSVGFIVIVGMVIYNECYGRNYNDRQLNKDLRVYSFKDGTCRVYNRDLRKYTTKKISWVSNYVIDSLTVYADLGKRGFINVNTGEVMIDAHKNNYSRAWVFSEGLAAVMKDGKVGFINTANEVVIPFSFDYSDKTSTGYGSYVFRDGYSIVSTEDGRMGLIDVKGRWVVEPVYDRIHHPQERGCRIVVENGKLGVLDSLCNKKYPTEYVHIDIVSDGLVLSKDGRMWKEDFEGRIVKPFMVEQTDWLCYPVNHETCNEYVDYVLSDYAMYKVGGAYGILNRNSGEPITLAVYSDIKMISKKLFLVQLIECKDWCLMDLKGNIVSDE